MTKKKHQHEWLLHEIEEKANSRDYGIDYAYFWCKCGEVKKGLVKEGK